MYNEVRKIRYWSLLVFKGLILFFFLIHNGQPIRNLLQFWLIIYINQSFLVANIIDLANTKINKHYWL